MANISEKDLIQKILACFPKSGLHKNQFFESDSEVFDYKESQLLFTTDTFSDEDLFRENNPYQLGRNLAIATLSDILASGGNPLFYGHSMVVSKQWQQPFIIEFSKGVADVLKMVNAQFLGGDFGQSEHWNYTGTVIGEVVKPLSRMGAKAGDLVYLTGKAGAGNLEAALNLYSDLPLLGNLLKNYTTKFYNRFEEAKTIRNYATSCIDTSDGVFNAISTIASLNKCGYYLEKIPILPEAILAAKLLGKPSELLVMGECGEYELLFTIPIEKENEFSEEIAENNIEIHKIGHIREESVKKIRFDKRVLQLDKFEISARAFDTTKEYLAVLTEFVKNQR